ncbi:MAG: hypothetical protein HYW05_01060 [Candidatus Diapherotrites archaeon]|nr:hypothetical protein [Candidatus Diapherotrites archaeon]
MSEDLVKAVSEIEDWLATRKMEKISGEIKLGKRRLFTEQQIMRKYNLSGSPVQKTISII